MKKKIIVAVIALVVVSFVVSGYLGSRMARRMIEDGRHNIAGLALDIKDYDFSLLGGSLKLKGIIIYPSGNETEGAILASADEIYVKVSPLALIGGTLHAKEITLKKPQINYFIEKSGPNWQALKLAPEKKDEGAKKDGLNIIIDEVKIDDGAVAYHDLVKGQKLSLSNVDIEIENIAKAKKPGELPAKVSLEGNIGDTKGTVKVWGNADPLGEKISFDIKAKLSGTPITSFSSFYAGSVPFGIVAGGISVNSEAKATDNILKSTHNATISGLKADSSIKGNLVNKLVLSDPSPINVAVAVNGDLSEGKFSVATNVSKEIADQILKRAGTLVPNLVTDEIKKVAPKTLGNKLKGVFGR